MHSHASTQILSDYYSQDSTFGQKPHHNASKNICALSNQTPISSIQGNNNQNNDVQNCKPVSKIQGISHGKHSSLSDKNSGLPQQIPSMIRLPSIGQSLSQKGLMLNALPANNCGSLFDAENRFVNSCTSAQQKKRMIKVQSKNKFPSDFFNENCRSTQNTQQNEDEDTFSNNFKFFGNESNNKNTSFQNIQINLQNQANSLEIQSSIKSCQEILSNKQIDADYKQINNNASEQVIEKSTKNFKQIQIPQDNQLALRPFISARGSRATKSSTILPQQTLTSLNQKVRDSQVSKDNFIEQKYELTLNPQQLSTVDHSNYQSNKNLSKKQLNALSNIQSTQSTVRLNSVQTPSLTVSPNKALSILSPTSKNQNDIQESKPHIKIPNSPKNNSNQQQQQKQNQMNLQQTNTKVNLKRNQNYKIQSSANLHEAINKGSYSCRATADKKEKSFINTQKDNESGELLQEKDANRFINKKSVGVNKTKNSNIDFTNFKMPLNSLTKKIKEISSIQNTQNKLIKGKSSQDQLDISQTASTSSSGSSQNQEKMKFKSLSQTTIEFPESKSQITPESIQDNLIEECIDDQRLIPSNSAKEEQIFDIDNSDSTKNSIQQNNTLIFNSPRIQEENLYLFSDKNIQSTQNSMLALPIPQLKHFNSDSCGNSTLNQLYSPILQYQISSPQQISTFNDKTIFNFESRKSSSQLNMSCNLVNNPYLKDTQVIQEETIQENFNNNYNLTANFSDAKGQIDFNLENKEQKLKQSQKNKPKIALSFKESEKYKPFLIRKMNSQCSMRVKPYNLNDYSGQSSNCSQTNNTIFDFNKNGSASTAHGTSNEYINSHEFSFSNS